MAKPITQENPVATKPLPDVSVGVNLTKAPRVTVIKMFAFGEAIPVEVPELADIEAYRTSSTTWVGVPWGEGSWSEPTLGGATLFKVIDIDLPATAAPVGGYPIVVFFHANGTTRTVGGSGSMYDYIKAPALAAGFAFITVEFRHPVANAAIGSPHTDTGLAVQFIRSLCPALNCDKTKVYGICRSRGNLALWQTVQADMAAPYADTYAERQSSRLQGIWGIQSQIAYGTQRFCDLYIEPADHAAVLAENPDNALWKNAVDDFPTADVLPQLVMIHEDAYFGGLISKATLDGSGVSVVHFPDAGRLTKAAYAARGLGSRVCVVDAETSVGDNVEQLADMVPWVKYLIEGMSSSEAFAMARALRRSAQAHYLRDDLVGVSVNSDGTGGAPSLTGPVGGIVAGQHGLANRALGVSALGFGAGQNNSANKPKLASMGSGRYGLLFDSTDRLSVGMNSDGTPNWVGWTLTGEVTTLGSAATNNYTFGQGPLDGLTLALSIGSDAAITANDMKVYRNFAATWAGVAYP